MLQHQPNRLADVNKDKSYHPKREMIMTTLVVTRHPGLVDYLLDTGVITAGNYTVVDHASPDVVKGKDVIGVLPHSLSCLCATFTEIPLRIPAEKRGQELTLEDMRQFAGSPVTYKVTVVE